jgi:hypothetical protein
MVCTDSTRIASLTFVEIVRSPSGLDSALSTTSSSSISRVRSKNLYNSLLDVWSYDYWTRLTKSIDAVGQTLWTSIWSTLTRRTYILENWGRNRFVRQLWVCWETKARRFYLHSNILIGIVLGEFEQRSMMWFCKIYAIAESTQN